MDRMSGRVRNLQFDVALVAAPRVALWPSPGVRIVSELCARFGLRVGWIGGNELQARGVLALPGTGGVVFAEDAQKRIYRIESRAIVRWVPRDEMPDPFEGSFSRGLIPGMTALRLMKRKVLEFGQSVALLGTDNRAFRFGSDLLEGGAHEVFIIETSANWGGKRYAGWEVEKRRFEMLGGRLLEATPVSLRNRRPLVWELRVQDARGIRVLEVNRVISFGPFQKRYIFQEYPQGSLLYRFEQQALEKQEQDSSGWMREEEAAHYLASRIIKGLVPEIGPGKEDLDFIYRRSRSRLHRMELFLDEPFSFGFQGKWLAASSLNSVKSFSGVPSSPIPGKELASIECFESIGCNLCEKACPENAISLERLKSRRPEEARPLLNPDLCTGCGVCTVACPSATPVLIQERPDQSLSIVGFGMGGKEKFSAGETVVALNRRGESLGTVRVVSETEVLHQGGTRRVLRLEVPTHLIWEVRWVRKPSSHATALDPDFQQFEQKEREVEKAVEITLDGEKRLVRERLTVQEALFEFGINRPADQLHCPDGSCGLCELEIDGVKQLACRSVVRRGMSVRIEGRQDLARAEAAASQPMICPCMQVSRDELAMRIREGTIQSPDTALQTTGVGAGRCHGQLCLEPAQRCFSENGIELQGYTDWKFPWMDWKITPGSVE